MGYALKYEQSLETTSCITCGMEFAVPTWWLKNKRDNNGSLWCPNGHCLTYQGETADQKIARLEREKANMESSKRFAEQRLELEKANHQKELKRRDKRAHAGMCQHCNRTFSQLARHMNSKHKSQASKGCDGKVL